MDNQLVSAVYTEGAVEGVSPKYRHIKTIDIVNYLEELSWVPKTSSNFSNRPGYDPNHCKHWVKFYQGAGNPDIDINLTLVNSHDRSIPFRVYIGFTKAGTNVPFTIGGPACFMNMRHIGHAPDHLKDNLNATLLYVPTVAENISKMCQVIITQEEIYSMALAAADLRWPGKGGMVASYVAAPPMNAYISSDMSVQENPFTLFAAYTRIQTRILMGGYRVQTKGIKRLHATARPIKSFKRQVAIGQACWAMAMNILTSRSLNE